LAGFGGRLAVVAMKMRQSLAQLEQEFRHEMQLDRSRRENLRRRAVVRSRKRTHEREKKRSSMRFWVLLSSLIATAVIVTVAMFETLYYLLG
jgi:membrane glycosyltransferase